MFKHSTRTAIVFLLSVGLVAVGSTVAQAVSSAHNESPLSLTRASLAQAPTVGPHRAPPAAVANPGARTANTSPTQQRSGTSGGSQSAVTCDGHTDTTAALQAAVNNGGTVNLPAGTCVLTNRIAIKRAVTIDGAGQTATHLVQHSRVNIFQIVADGVTIENLDMNTATYNPGAPPIPKNPVPGTVFDNANNTTLLNVSSEAGTGFGMRFTGPSPCSSDQRGGLSITNVSSTNTGRGGFTALDVACQSSARLSNITIHGDYIALFEDSNVTLNGERYTPDAKADQFAVYITAPALNISISNVTGGGGVKQAGTPLANITLANVK